jgi:hypothetical protein
MLSWSGNTEFVIVLFIIFVIGFAITGLASFNNLADIPSLPVAFLTLVNDFFINVAKDIGNVTVVDKNHPSIIEINKNKKDIPNLACPVCQK